jgi:hypothetical protein
VPTCIDLSPVANVVHPRVVFGCTETVSKPLVFGAPEICLSEKQSPQVIVFIRSRQNEKSV